jgi:hypothetical protein
MPRKRSKSPNRRKSKSKSKSRSRSAGRRKAAGHTGAVALQQKMQGIMKQGNLPAAINVCLQSRAPATLRKLVANLGITDIPDATAMRRSGDSWKGHVCNLIAIKVAQKLLDKAGAAAAKVEPEVIVKLFEEAPTPAKAEAAVAKIVEKLGCEAEMNRHMCNNPEFHGTVENVNGEQMKLRDCYWNLKDQNCQPLAKERRLPATMQFSEGTYSKYVAPARKPVAANEAPKMSAGERCHREGNEDACDKMTGCYWNNKDGNCNVLEL